MMGRVRCTFNVLLKMVLASEMMCLGDCADVRERADVSAGSSWIYGILHVCANNIACVSGEIMEMFFIDLDELHLLQLINVANK